MKIAIELAEEIVEEFKELPKFWVFDEGELTKPTIQQTLKKFIIDNINERRIELATSQAAIDTIKLEDKDIVVCEEK